MLHVQKAMYDRYKTVVASEHLEETTDYLVANAARGARICILIGYRAYRYGKYIEKLAEHLRAPMFTMLDSKGGISESHRLSYGCIGLASHPAWGVAQDMLQTCEIIVSVCARDLIMCGLTARDTGGQVRDKHLRLIAIA